MATSMFIPQHFHHNSEAYCKILQLKKDFPNDQEFGKMVRKYLDDIAEGKIFKYSSIEFDTQK